MYIAVISTLVWTLVTFTYRIGKKMLSPDQQHYTKCQICITKDIVNRRYHSFFYIVHLYCNDLSGFCRSHTIELTRDVMGIL